MRQIGFALPFFLMIGCGPHNTPVSIAPPSAELPSYIDLQPGWRLRAIVPLTQSGTFGPAAASVLNADSANRTVTVAAKSDFLGYETQYYGVGKHGRGVRIQFDLATSTKNGQTVAQNQPTIDLFRLPPRDKYIRLLYLRRASPADHNMAVIAARQVRQLAFLTASIQRTPSACVSSTQGFCSWIPVGIAVRPEMQQTSEETSEWVPVR